MEKKSKRPTASISTIAHPVLRILERESDRAHPLLQKQVIGFLKGEMPGSARLPNRKTVVECYKYLKSEGYDIQEALRGRGVYLGRRHLDEGLALRLSMLLASSEEFSKEEKQALVDSLYMDQSRYVRGRHLPKIQESISGNPAMAKGLSQAIHLIGRGIEEGIPFRANLRGEGEVTLLPLGWSFGSSLSVEALRWNEDKGGGGIPGDPCHEAPFGPRGPSGGRVLPEADPGL